ncbi:DNA repair ATPase [Leptospira kobayashii]|uniref:DNA repair ATPase n=1 Tax=Leptospira kobayashii TaxID=1917830 RepID=A0ABM7UIK9_9LEPT|nr:AAA family ATPase [Leptospira kobayashii]BDA78590.1 DNA repair ATPase [Leptospira kobayashii]
MNAGSKWSKWDLHVHTPSSIIQQYGNENEETWERFISDLENLPPEFSVIGINDYLFLDGYEKLLYEKSKNNRLKNIKLLLPVVEFRIDKFTGIEFGKFKRINLHVIFSNEIAVETIKSQFLQTLEQSYVLNTGEAWSRAITRESVSELGIKIKKNSPPSKLSKFGNDLTEGFNNLNIKEDEIFKSLKKDCFTGKYLTAIGKTEWGDLKWTDSSIATKKTIINSADLVFTSSESVSLFHNAKNALKAQKVNDLLLDCSDAHDFSYSQTKDRIGKCFTWIKADPTFDGLKQILFEPDNRLHIGENSPINPPIRIDKIVFDFPEELTFENDSFCFSGKNEINFSPNFTCLIGGRGVGKSTILNLIHEKLRPSENVFFKDKKIRSSENGKLVSIGSCIQIDEDSDEKYIEFLSQNEVEEFAKDHLKLTAAIYARILRRDENGTIAKLEKQLKSEISLFDQHISHKNRLTFLEADLIQKNKEIETNKRIIESFSNVEYIKINSEINTIASKLNDINESKKNYEQLGDELDKILENHNIKDNSNLYSEQINIIILGIQTLLSNAKAVDYSAVEELKKILSKELLSTKEKLRLYLSNKGLTEENQKDITNANLIANELNQELTKKNQEVQLLKATIADYNLEDMKNASIDYQNEIKKQIIAISNILENIENPSVKPISLHLEFDLEAACEKIFNDFKLLFGYRMDLSNVRNEAKLKEILFCLSPDQLSEREIFCEKIRDFKSTSILKPFLLELFAIDSNFELYKLITEKNLLDYSEFKKVKVRYDNKAIESSSFGQRCTAVLVILLLLGNNPIIIDEPEAHLDSLLISNYLVEVIKSRKRDRQIIFATHNANFVINGDAELIHILDIDETNNKTKIISTTIENFLTRDKLIGLEGGKEAFQKREYRYLR